jgi:hypothetical protein
MNFLISSTGHGWREIQDEWDFPRLERWIKYCERHPTLQAMVQAYLHIEYEEPLRVTEENIGDIMQMLCAGTGSKLNG